MSWMAEMSSYRYLAELKRRYRDADAAAEHAVPEPDASANDEEAARPLDTARPSA